MGIPGGTRYFSLKRPDQHTHTLLFLMGIPGGISHVAFFDGNVWRYFTHDHILVFRGILKAVLFHPTSFFDKQHDFCFLAERVGPDASAKTVPNTGGMASARIFFNGSVFI